MESGNQFLIKNKHEELPKPTFPTKSEYLANLEKMDQHDLAKTYEQVCALAQKIKESGGRGLLVGGCVRDTFFGKIAKDFDMEVYGIQPEDLSGMLPEFGRTEEVGKAFGITKIFPGTGYDIDVSIPRKDSKVADGHNGFAIELCPDMSIKDAARRRDFTINTLAADPLTGELFDDYGGIQDIKDRVLRVTDPELFKDDPLRVLRGLQFSGRFALNADQATKDIMSEMVPRVKELPKSRIVDEWRKMLTKSERPSVGLMLGQEIGYWKEINPELAKLSETPQDPEWHPEGDVWTHTLMVLDQAASVCRRNNLDQDESFTIMLAALTHDIAKPEKTFEDERGRIVSPGHEHAGGEPARNLLTELGVDGATKDKVVPLVMNHMAPSALYRESLKGKPVTPGTLKRLATRLQPATISELVMVCESDSRGRGPFLDEEGKPIIVNEYMIGTWLENEARKAKVYDKKPEDFIRGKDLIDAGFRPGKDYRKIIDLSNKIKDLEDQLVMIESPQELSSYSKEDLLSMVKNLDSTNDAITALTIKGIDTVNSIRAILKSRLDKQN